MSIRTKREDTKRFGSDGSWSLGVAAYRYVKKIWKDLLMLIFFQIKEQVSVIAEFSCTEASIHKYFDYLL